MGIDSSEANQIINAIDFVNHHYGGSAKVTGEFFCKDCNEKFPSGEFRYDKGGYIPGPGLINLSSERAAFPLHEFHTVLALKDSDEIYEKRVILDLFNKSRNWNFYDVPERCFEDYMKIMKTSSLISIASLEANHWCYSLHSTPDFTEEEMLEDPIKRDILEMDRKINLRPNKLENEVKPEINRVFKDIIGNREIPIIYIIPEEFRGDFGEEYYKRDFIEATYNTFKAKNILFPDEKRNSVIKIIDSYFKEAELKHERHPSPF